MHLSWLGLSSCKFETKEAVVVTDPYAPSVGPRPLRAKADVVTVSNPEHPEHGHIAALSGNPFVVDHQGEFEVKGIYIEGIRDTPTTMFTFDVEGLRLAHLGDLRAVPPDSVLEKLTGVDILFLPVGGRVTLEPETAMRVVNAVEPHVVVPIHFHQDGWKVSEKLLPVSAFLREIGSSKVEPVDRISIKKRDLSEKTQVVVFSVGR